MQHIWNIEGVKGQLLFMESKHAGLTEAERRLTRCLTRMRGAGKLAA